MFVRHGVPAAQVGNAFELPKEENESPTPKVEKEEENVISKEG